MVKIIHKSSNTYKHKGANTFKIINLHNTFFKIHLYVYLHLYLYKFITNTYLINVY